MTNQVVNQKEAKKTIDELVANKITKYDQTGELDLPADYSYQNALKSAWLVLPTVKDRYKAPAIQVCTPDSIANALLEMVVQGLDPIKKQCYFIVRGSQLVLETSYFGMMAITKRVAGVKEIFAQVVHEGDHVEIEVIDGAATIAKHTFPFGNINKDKIIGSYCTILFENGLKFTELMTIDELRTAWSKSDMKKNQNSEGAVHQEFRQEMAKKTVIRRACKKFINSSSDATLMAKHLEAAETRSYEATLLEEVKESANQTPMTVQGLEMPQQVVAAPVQQTPPVEVVESELVKEPVSVNQNANYVHESVQAEPHVEHPNLVDVAHEQQPFPDAPPVVDGQFMDEDVPF